MKKLLAVLAAALIALPVFVRAEDVVAGEKPKEFVVYNDKNAKDNHYIPSGWMGDYGEDRKSTRLNSSH